MKNGLMLSLVAGLAVVCSGRAADSLKLGDPAPKLQVAKWVQGEPVTQFETGKVYVVEFWATWCGPCKVSIPHLNELSQKFKDKGVVMIGQDCLEEDESLVAPFVKKMGTNMTYRVALDDKSKVENGAMATTWLDAAGQNGIPTAFVVNKQGRIAWIGHPMEMEAKLFEDILADRYDIAKAAADMAKAEATQRQLQELSQKFRAAMTSEKWDEANSIVDEMAKAAPENTIAPQVMKMNILLMQKKYDEAYKLAAAISDAHPDEVELQDALAWNMAAQPGLEKRDTVLAEKIAERANKASDGKNPSVLDTLARTQFMNGKKDEAIATEKKALSLAEGEVSGALKKNLESYQDGKLPAVGP